MAADNVHRWVGDDETQNDPSFLLLSQRIETLSHQFSNLSVADIQRHLVQKGLEYASKMSLPMQEEEKDKVESLSSFQRVPGCVSTVWVRTVLDEQQKRAGQVVARMEGMADAYIARGLLAIVATVLNDVPIQAILAIRPNMLAESIGIKLALSTGRNDGLASIVRTIQLQIQQQQQQQIQKTQNGTATDHPKIPNVTNKQRKPSVALLLSGGVDSSVALALLKQSQQYDITAFYLRIWLADELSHLNECPWQEDYRICQQVCDHLNVPLETVSLQEEYQNTVLNYTLTQVQSGRTPNPDVLCNSRIKFGCFYEYAIRIRNFDYVASGHYAQVQHSETDGNVKLLRSPDPIKDQSYFLCTLSQAQLRRVLFPVGQYPKSEIRKLADETFRLPNRHRPDSQGLCFLGKFKFDEFLSGQLDDRPGDIVDAATGIRLGRHRGIWYHTIGQRKGLGNHLHPHATAQGPWYVVAKDPARNIVYCSNAYDDDQLFAQSRRQFTVENLHWIAGHAPECPTKKSKETCSPGNSTIIYSHFTMKIRHGPKLVTGTLMLDDKVSSVGEVSLDAKDSGLAPGQYVAFYDGLECVGAGVIGERHWTRFLEDPLRQKYVAASG